MRGPGGGVAARSPVTTSPPTIDEPRGSPAPKYVAPTAYPTVALQGFKGWQAVPGHAAGVRKERESPLNGGCAGKSLAAVDRTLSTLEQNQHNQRTHVSRNTPHDTTAVKRGRL